VGYLDKALEALEQQGSRMIDHDLVNRTLRKIGAEYKPGLLAWIREDQNRWRRLLDLENKINQAALTMDEAALKEMLSEYRSFFEKMLIEYGKGETLPLYPGKDKGSMTRWANTEKR
jgi:hypothetical protein